MIAVLGAMAQEVAGLRRLMVVEEVRRDGVCRTWRGRRRGQGVLLVETGIGRLRAERAVAHVLDSSAFTVVLSVGFGGALCNGFGIGDVVVCRALCADVAPAGELLDLDGKLLGLCRRVGGELHQLVKIVEGTCVTVGLPVCRVQRRVELARDYDAGLVDMESYWIGRIALARGLPFLCIRCVSDSAEQELPAFDRMMTREGKWRVGATASHFLRNPWNVGRLARLRAQERVAGRQLTVFLDALVQAL
jgi:adenosylhomocysteine nucleosidase